MKKSPDRRYAYVLGKTPGADRAMPDLLGISPEIGGAMRNHVGNRAEIPASEKPSGLAEYILGLLETMDLIPNIGVGEIRFGMKRGKVAAILGPDITAEPWMGGNLNDALLYPGIILHFDKHDSHGSLARGRLIQIEVNASFPGNLFGRSLPTLTRQDILSRLSMLGHPVKEFRNRSIEVSSLHAQFWFTSDAALDVVLLHCGDTVNMDTWRGLRQPRSFLRRIGAALGINYTLLCYRPTRRSRERLDHVLLPFSRQGPGVPELILSRPLNA